MVIQKIWRHANGLNEFGYQYSSARRNIAYLDHHETLATSYMLHVLKLYGIDTKWFYNYLSGHTQRVQIRTIDDKTLLSKLASNSIGICQGTALGPLVFSVFSNDMHLHVSDAVKIVQHELVRWRYSANG